jgi:septum site-determining protein MinC
MKKDEVIIKGTREGIIIILDDEVELSQLKKQLEEKLLSADNFLFGAQVVLDLGRRKLGDEEIIELERMITRQQGMSLKRIACKMGLDKGQSTPKEKQEEISMEKGSSKVSGKETNVENDKFSFIAKQIYKREEVNTPVESRDLPSSLTSDYEEALFVKKTVRSGQSVHYDGSIIILGDVNPGAEVVATGDIMVMGSLRGVAHAGARGNEKSVVMAFKLQPTQLRIANHITRPPDEDMIGPSYPEIARIKEGAIMIEIYQSNSDRQNRINQSL